jgi:hypothetical protein
VNCAWLCTVGLYTFLQYWADITVSLSSLAITMHNSHDKYFTYAYFLGGGFSLFERAYLVSVIPNKLTTFGRGRPFGGVQRVKKSSNKVSEEFQRSRSAVRTFRQSRSGVRGGRAELVCGVSVW